MEIYLPIEVKNKILLSEKGGYLIGEKFYDIFFITDIYSGTIKSKIAAIKNLIGEFQFFKVKREEKLNIKKKLNKIEMQWIFLLIKEKGDKKTLKGYLKTLSEDQKKPIVIKLKIMVI